MKEITKAVSSSLSSCLLLIVIHRRSIEMQYMQKIINHYIYSPKKESVYAKKEHYKKDMFHLFPENYMKAQINQFVTTQEISAHYGDHSCGHGESKTRRVKHKSRTLSIWYDLHLH